MGRMVTRRKGSDCVDIWREWRAVGWLGSTIHYQCLSTYPKIPTNCLAYLPHLPGQRHGIAVLGTGLINQTEKRFTVSYKTLMSLIRRAMCQFRDRSFPENTLRGIHCQKLLIRPPDFISNTQRWSKRPPYKIACASTLWPASELKFPQ